MINISRNLRNKGGRYHIRVALRNINQFADKLKNHDELVLPDPMYWVADQSMRHARTTTPSESEGMDAK